MCMVHREMTTNIKKQVSNAKIGGENIVDGII